MGVLMPFKGEKGVSVFQEGGGGFGCTSMPLKGEEGGLGLQMPFKEEEGVWAYLMPPFKGEEGFLCTGAYQRGGGVWA